MPDLPLEPGAISCRLSSRLGEVFHGASGFLFGELPRVFEIKDNRIAGSRGFVLTHGPGAGIYRTERGGG